MPRALGNPSAKWRQTFLQYKSVPHYSGDLADLSDNDPIYQKEGYMSNIVFKASETWDDLVHSNLEWFNGNIKSTPTYGASMLNPDQTPTDLIRLHREYRVFTTDGQGPRDDSITLERGQVVETQQRSYLWGAFPVEDIEFWQGVLKKTNLLYVLNVVGSKQLYDNNPASIEDTGYYFSTNVPYENQRFVVTQERSFTYDLRRKPQWDPFTFFTPPDTFFSSFYPERIKTWAATNVCYFSFADRSYNGRSVESQLFEALRTS
jgi:hypothetical protein